MPQIQPLILQDIPINAKYLYFNLIPGADVQAGLQTLNNLYDADSMVIGLGQSLISACNTKVPGIKAFPSNSQSAVRIPSTPTDLWIWLANSDRGQLFHQSSQIEMALADCFVLEQLVDAFKYEDGRDLSGFEDGTENPEGEDAVATAMLSGAGKGLDGSSFVAVQQWQHDMFAFQNLTAAEQDDCIGRCAEDNQELEDAPVSAHVRRTEQEDFDPPAFMLRRSMPWTEGMTAGLMFVAFGNSFAAFEAVLKRMTGAEDDVTDALFGFTQPITGGYYWCPPVEGDRLNLSALSN